MLLRNIRELKSKPRNSFMIKDLAICIFNYMYILSIYMSYLLDRKLLWTICPNFLVFFSFTAWGSTLILRYFVDNTASFSVVVFMLTMLHYAHNVTNSERFSSLKNSVLECHRKC